MSDPRPPSLLTRVVAYGPVVLLIAVALVQLWCALVDGRLTPAKGGGFGLFSTVDKLNNRQLRAYVRSAPTGQERPVTIPGAVLRDFRLDGWSLKAFPSAARLRRFARQVAARIERAPADAIRLEVVKMTFDAHRNEARFVPVSEVVYPETRE